MKELDDLARAAVAELRAAAAEAARTEEGLAGVRAPQPSRRWAVMLSLAAASILLFAGVWWAVHDDGRGSIAPASTPVVQPTQVPATTTPLTNPTTVSTTAVSTTAVSTTAVSTTVPHPVSAVVLRGDGVGDARFGDAAGAAVAELTARFGASVSDASGTNPVTAPELFDPNNPDGDWVYPASRQVCWGVAPQPALCVDFAGDTPSTLVMVGWAYFDNDPAYSGPRLTDGAGLTIGMHWADFLDHLSSPTKGCYGFAAARTPDGIVVDLMSSSQVFGYCGDVSLPTDVPTPDPATVRVQGMRSGRQTTYYGH